MIGLGRDMLAGLGEAPGEKLSSKLSGFFGISIGVDIFLSLEEIQNFTPILASKLTIRLQVEDPFK
jgi:uncharacterized membrane protein YczE